MKRIYFLSTCDKCKMILREVDNLSDYQLIDIKFQHISSETLDFLVEIVGSYEGLFNKRAIKFKDEKLRSSIKKDLDYRELILNEYTFLKRPIFINNQKVGVEKAV